MKKCESYFGDYKCHVATNITDSNGKTVCVDKCLKEAVENLNAKGFKTIASCCGHGIVNPRISIEGLTDYVQHQPEKEEAFNCDDKILKEEDRKSIPELWEYKVENNISDEDYKCILIKHGYLPKGTSIKINTLK